MFRGRPVPPGEAQWLPSDRAAALAWQAEQKATCGGCGRLWEETTDFEADEDYEARVVTCHACAEKARKRAELARDKVNTDGAYVTVHLADHVTQGVNGHVR